MYELIEGFEWVKTQVITLKDCPSCYVTMNHRVKISWKIRGVEKHICSFASWILSKDPRHYNDRKQSIYSKEATTVRVSSLGKAVEYKVMNATSTHKIQLCLYASAINNLKIKLQNQFLIITVPKRIKHLVVILNKEMRGSYVESDKIYRN